MKTKMLPAVLLLVFAWNQAKSQCTGCTVTISTPTATPQVVTAGTTLCITAGGDVQGGIAVDGGTVCNEGLISSDVAMSSGMLNNYGTISGYIAMSGGSATNDGVIDADSLGIAGSGSVFVNNDTIWALSMGYGADLGSAFTNNGFIEVDTVACGGDQGTFENNGEITGVLYFGYGGDNGSVFTNNGTLDADTVAIGGQNFTVTNTGDIFGVLLSYADGGNSSFTNQTTGEIDMDTMITAGTVIDNFGLITVNGPFSHNLGTFSNYGDMSVGGDFTNTADFYTNCMIDVDGSWINAMTCRGPMTGCGGFTVSGPVTTNTGNFATDGSNLDMCHPPFHFTVQNGTVGPNVTNCICTTTCAPSIGINDLVQDLKLKVYPNPANDLLIVESEEGLGSVELLDAAGRRVWNKQVLGSRTELSVAEFEPGMYILKVGEKTTQVVLQR